MNWIDFKGDCIVLSFFNDCLLIDVVTDAVFLNGNPLNVSRKPYKKGLMKPLNKDKNKKRILTLEHKTYVLGVDEGFDGRLFFKIWLKSTYKKFRGKPFWVASYWNDAVNKEKKFFENDLKVPVKVWGFKKCVGLVQCSEKKR